MTAPKYVKLRGDHAHPELLANGQTVVPGEPFDKSLLITKADNGLTDARLLDDGLIIDSAAPAKED